LTQNVTPNAPRYFKVIEVSEGQQFLETQVKT